MGKVEIRPQIQILLIICAFTIAMSIMRSWIHKLPQTAYGKGQLDSLATKLLSGESDRLNSDSKLDSLPDDRRAQFMYPIPKTGNADVLSYVYLPLIARPPVLPSIRNSSFEETNAIWGQSSECCSKLIFEQSELTAIGINPHTGTHLAWLGGKNAETSKLSQNINLTSDYSTLQLNFWYWIKSDDFCGNDYVQIKINHAEVYRIELCKSFATYRWIQNFVVITPYIGTDILVEFVANTNGSLVSHFLLDDVTIQP